MSRYANFDTTDNTYQIASNLGWTEIGTWVDSLDHESYPALVQLWEHGSTSDVSALIEEIEAAIEDSTPNDDVKASLELLLEALHENDSSESVFVTQ